MSRLKKSGTDIRYNVSTKMKKIISRTFASIFFIFSFYIHLVLGIRDCGYTCHVPMGFVHAPILLVLCVIVGLSVIYLVSRFILKVQTESIRPRIGIAIYILIFVYAVLSFGMRVVGDAVWQTGLRTPLGDSGLICEVTLRQDDCYTYLAMVKQDPKFCHKIESSEYNVNNDIYGEATTDNYSSCVHEVVSFGDIYTDEAIALDFCDKIEPRYTALIDFCKKDLIEKGVRRNDALSIETEHQSHILPFGISVGALEKEWVSVDHYGLQKSDLMHALNICTGLFCSEFTSCEKESYHLCFEAAVDFSKRGIDVNSDQMARTVMQKKSDQMTHDVTTQCRKQYCPGGSSCDTFEYRECYARGTKG